MLRQFKCHETLLVFILLLFFSQAWAAEPPVHYFDCKECHMPGLSPTELDHGNLCLKCHHLASSDIGLNPGAPPELDGHTDRRFSSGEASNAFGHGTGLPTADQTSHNWAVATDTLAEAGAQAPTRSLHPEFYSRYGTSSGKLTCSRCHDPHGRLSNTKLLVKGNNSAEAMCRACHQPWDQEENHGLLTHPLVSDYNAKAAAFPDKYRMALVNKENADIQLVAGSVSCTSCHGVHFADSDASTVDGPTELPSKSDGKLLRGDGPQQEDKSSLCQTCHIYQNHGDDIGEKPGCMVCHSGHSYDPNYPNYFVLRKSATTTTYNTVTGLEYWSPSVLDEAQKYQFWNDGTDGTSEGYCEKCHGDAKGIGLGAGGYHVASAICTDCHKHDSDQGGFSANCGACHGNGTTQEAWPDSIANNGEPAYSWADDAGSHAIHVAAIGTSNASCATCHPGNPPVDHYDDSTTGPQQAEVTRMDTNNDGIADYWRFAGGALSGSGAPIYLQTETGTNDSDASYRTSDDTCVNINCHGGVSLRWGTTGCMSCHAVTQGNRTAVVGQFAANSHHVQGAALTAAQCYQCHWEASSDGSVNPTYHGGAFNRGATVDLVIFGAGTRPTSYDSGTTAVQYTADGSHSETSVINDHCLGCHSDQNSTTMPFSDGKTPQIYAWDGTSVSNRYSQSGTTSYGKYTGMANAARKIQTKAFSAHGMATLNQGGWSATTGVDGALPNTRAGAENVACFDCHNSHGSNVAGITTSYNSATLNGGLLKDTQIGFGGYNVSYQPIAGGTLAEKNLYNPGAGICFDCHMNADAGSQPWGYNATFGATAQIIGYSDPPYFTSTGAGNHLRYPYKNALNNKGGHFGASSDLENNAMGSINGLCTPCHDPHGVSPTLGGNQQYSVPMLKGTWLTSPYREDVTPQDNAPVTAPDWDNDRHIYLDQNTFGTNINNFNQLVAGITQTESQFAGLCLSCHPKSSLTRDGSGTANAWLSKERIHETVRGWKTSTGTVKHRFSCSKCHTPHSSGQPRLMVTNCMDRSHKGRVTWSSNPQFYGVNNNNWECNKGEGAIPGNYWYLEDCGPESGGPPPLPSYSNISCHEAYNGDRINSYIDSDGNQSTLYGTQTWNRLTPWGESAVTLFSQAATNFAPSATAGKVQANIIWESNLDSNSAVDYGTTSAYGQTVSNGDLSSTHNVLLASLTNHQTYHYRVRSTTFQLQEASSEDNSFDISVPPSVPVLTIQGAYECISPGVSPDCDITLEWNASTDPDGGPIGYEIQVSNDSAFTTPTSSGWITTTNWSITLGETNVMKYWRVRSRDQNHTEAVSAWASSSFGVSDGTDPEVDLINPAADYAGWTCDGHYDTSETDPSVWQYLDWEQGPLVFTWTTKAGTPPASEYELEVYRPADGTGLPLTYSSMSWANTFSWSTDVRGSWDQTWYFTWRVRGKNALTGLPGPWSELRSFSLKGDPGCI